MPGRSCRLAAVGLALLAAGTAKADSAPDAGHRPSVVEPIEGTDLHRVILTDGSARRLGIEIGAVLHQKVTRSHAIEGVISTAPFPSSLQPFLPDEGSPPVTVMRMPPTSAVAFATAGQAASVRPVSGTGAMEARVTTQLVAVVEAEAPDESGDMFVVITGNHHGPIVLFAYSGTQAVRKTIPATALFYDEQGMTWVFTNPDPLVFIRHPVVVDFVQSDQAILKDGPPDGTRIVTAGAMLLLGTEFGIGH